MDDATVTLAGDPSMPDARLAPKLCSEFTGQVDFRYCDNPEEDK